MKPTYVIEYFNKVFQESYRIEIDDFEEALKKVRSINSLVEMENVRLYECREVEYK